MILVFDFSILDKLLSKIKKLKYIQNVRFCRRIKCVRLTANTMFYIGYHCYRVRSYLRLVVVCVSKYYIMAFKYCASANCKNIQERTTNQKCGFENK